MSKPNKAPAFQWYPKDWLTDEKVMLMTCEERGAYFHLLNHAWLNEDCSLPDDDKSLAILSGANGRWEHVFPSVRDMFEQKGDRLFNKRLLKEREKQNKFRESKRKAGIQSGKARRASVLDGGTRVQLRSNKTRTKTNSSSSASSSSSTSDIDLEKETIKEKDFDLFWKAYPKKIGKGAAQKSWKKIKPSKKLSATIIEAVKMQSKSPQWTKDGGQFIPHPATWLNQERWNDEVFVAPDEITKTQAFKGLSLKARIEKVAEPHLNYTWNMNSASVHAKLKTALNPSPHTSLRLSRAWWAKLRGERHERNTPR
jgi:uncharacterized protein YdaU (DUF1376 family)